MPARARVWVTRHVPRDGILSRAPPLAPRPFDPARRASLAHAGARGLGEGCSIIAATLRKLRVEAWECNFEDGTARIEKVFNMHRA